MLGLASGVWSLLTLGYGGGGGGGGEEAAPISATPLADASLALLLLLLNHWTGRRQQLCILGLKKILKNKIPY